MGLWDKIKGEFIDIIEWLDDSSDTMVHRFERHGNEIKYGARLTVRPAQAAVFVNEGQIADVFTPGMYTLETSNLPILSTLMGWKHGFQSPFKAEVYFVTTRQFTDLKWGTKNPVMMRDQEFGPVRLRAFGTYAMKVKDPKLFIEEIVGTDGTFTKDEITDQIRNIVLTRFADTLGESRIPILDLASNYDELSKFVSDRITPEVQKYGLDLTIFLVENISLPPSVEEALDKRSSMGIVGDLSRYTQFETATAIEEAAKAPGGSAGAAMGLGLGVAAAAQLGHVLTNAATGLSGAAGGGGAGAATPPAVPPVLQFFTVQGGAQQGPFPIDAVATQIRGGGLTPDTLVWRQGLPGWVPASQVVELAPLFAAQTPPPLPPPIPPSSG
jgi:membrane protease subunit (stomatin/prohibitin family)